MENISIKYTFALEDGGMQVLTIKDIREDILDTDVIAFAQKLIAKGAESKKGSKFSSVVKREKITTNTQII